MENWRRGAKFHFTLRPKHSLGGLSTSTSTSYDAPSIVTTMHPREQTIYLHLINKQTKILKKIKKVTNLHIYRMENCLDVVGLDL